MSNTSPFSLWSCVRTESAKLPEECRALIAMARAIELLPPPGGPDISIDIPGTMDPLWLNSSPLFESGSTSVELLNWLMRASKEEENVEKRGKADVDNRSAAVDDCICA